MCLLLCPRFAVVMVATSFGCFVVCVVLVVPCEVVLVCVCVRVSSASVELSFVFLASPSVVVCAGRPVFVWSRYFSFFPFTLSPL